MNYKITQVIKRLKRVFLKYFTATFLKSVVEIFYHKSTGIYFYFDDLLWQQYQQIDKQDKVEIETKSETESAVLHNHCGKLWHWPKDDLDLLNMP